MFARWVLLGSHTEHRPFVIDWDAMPATPAMYNPDAQPPRWFVAQYTSGACNTCGTPIYEGEEIAHVYDDQDQVRTLVRRECCGTDDEIEEPFTAKKGQERIRVIPPGGKRDACSRCFIIHTAAQGDECE